jgi:hypothetical protein
MGIGPGVLNMAHCYRLSLMALILLVVCVGAQGSSLQAQGSEGQGQPRFTKAPNGVIADHTTGLDWYVGQEGNWHQAKAWVENLKVAGGGWRLPTMAELKALYQPGASANNMDPLFNTTVAWAWSGELNNAWSVWGFAFYSGLEGWHSMSYGNGRLALAVRAHR